MTVNIRIFSLHKALGELHEVTAYLQQQWAPEGSIKVYENVLYRRIGAKDPLLQWYWLQNGDSTVDCAGLIIDDFISRGELWLWLCALYADPRYRGHGLTFRLIEHIAQQAKQLGFMQLHLCTDLEGLYERTRFYFDGPGCHPWGEVSRVCSRNL